MPAAAAADASASATLQLKIETTKRTEVKVVGDGKTLFKGRLRSDASKAFEARDGFEVTAGDASHVQIVLNGRNIPFSSANGHHASITLSRKDLKPREEIFR